MADDYRSKHNGKDPPEGYGYDTAHKKGLEEENKDRKDKGQGSSVVSSDYDKGGSTYTIKNSNGSSETHTIYDKPPKTTYNPPPGKKK
jgi:hypothetical protein